MTDHLTLYWKKPEADSNLNLVNLTFLLKTRYMKNQESVIYTEFQHQKMVFVCCLKAFFFNELLLVSYGIVYCILAMVAWLREINILYFLGSSYITLEKVLFQHVLLL